MKELINRLAFMFYEVLCRIMFVYNVKSSKSADHQNRYNQLAAINGVMVVLFADAIILVELVCNILNVELQFFPQVVIISVAISLPLIFFFLHRNSYFEDVFIPKETALPISIRLYHYAISTFIFIVIPAILATLMLGGHV